MEKVFENNAQTAAIFINEEFVVYKMSGKIALEDYKEAFNKLLQAMQAHQHSSVLFDYSELISDPALGRAWFLSSFVPRAKSLLQPNSHLAIVQASSVFQRMALQFIVKACHEMGLKFKLQYFEQYAEAENWIKKGIKVPV